MASLAKDGNGWRILFVCPATGKRRTVRTGKCAKKSAETTLNMIERLVEARALGGTINQQAAAWLEAIRGTPLRDRLTKAGLAPEVNAILLGPFVAQYVEARRDVKPASKTVWRQGQASLYEFFGEDRPVHVISHAEADDFKQQLIGQGLALYTVRKRLQVSKMFFTAMVKRGLIPSNPFDGVQVKAVVDESRNVFVSRTDAEAVMEEAPDAEWRAMIALSRFGGLRLPSEVLSLRWEHIDWARKRITVISPKTAHNPGGGQRIIPLFPELVRPLIEASEQAPKGAEFVVTRHRSQADSPEGWRNSNLRTRFNKMVRRAGLTPWPKPFHAMRASFETDLTERYPVQVASAWLGNSPKVALAHYLRVLPEHFEKATREPINANERPAQIPAHQPPVEACQPSPRNEKSPVIAANDRAWGVMETPQADGRGFEPPLDFRPKRFSRPPP